MTRHIRRYKGLLDYEKVTLITLMWADYESKSVASLNGIIEIAQGQLRRTPDEPRWRRKREELGIRIEELEKIKTRKMGENDNEPDSSNER